MAQWQKITPNFSGANGALAVASGSFAKAGGLASQLADNIRQRDMAEAKKAALLSNTINDGRKTEYLLDSDQRQVDLAQYQDALNKFQTNQQNQQILQAQQEAMPEAKNKLKVAFEQALNKQVAPITGLQVGQMGPAHPNTVVTEGKPLTPEQVEQNQQVENANVRAQTALGNFETFNTPVARKDLYKATLDRLLAQNTGLPLETLQAKAQAYVNQELGALPSAETIKAQNEMADTIYTTESNTLKEMMQAMRSGANTPSVNVAINGTGVGSKNMGQQSVSNANDPMAIDKWIKTVVGNESNSGPLDVAFQWGSKDQSIDADDLKTAVQFYKTNFPELSNNQIMSYLGNEVKAGRLSDYYGDDTIFPSSTKAKVTPKLIKIAQDMQKYGADKSTMRDKAFGANGQITDVKAAKAILGEQFKQYNQLLQQQKQLTKEYMTTRAGITSSQVGKSHDQLASDLIKKYVMPTTKKVDPKLVKVAPKVADIAKTNLFKDTKNPIAIAMRTKDPEGKSSLATLLHKNPTSYTKAFKALTKSEQAAVVKYVQSSKFKKLMHSNTNTDRDTTDGGVSKILINKPSTIAKAELGNSYDTIKLRKAGYIPEYNALHEIVGWKNPRLLHIEQEQKRKAGTQRIANTINPTGSSKFGFGSSEPHKPTAAELYQQSLLHK